MPDTLRDPYLDLVPILGQAGALTVQDMTGCADQARNQPGNEHYFAAEFHALHAAGLTLDESLVLVGLCGHWVQGTRRRSVFLHAVESRIHEELDTDGVRARGGLSGQEIHGWVLADGWLPVAADPKFALTAARAGLNGHEASAAARTGEPSRTVLAVMSALHQSGSC
ncbi:hypothetical protein [Tessaracoccus sp.]